MTPPADCLFLRERVGSFREFSADRLQPRVEARDAVAVQGDEAMPRGVVLIDTLNVSHSDGGELVRGDVRVPLHPSFVPAMQIDPAEANAANVQTGAQGFIDGIQSEG